MRPKSSSAKRPAEQVVKDIRRATRRHFSAEDKIRIVLEGLRGDDSIAELCRKEGIAQSLYYTWSKEFMEAGKRRLAGDTARAATTGDVQELRRDRPSTPSRVWNRIPDAIHDLIIEMALEQSELSPRELAVRFTDEMRYFVSEATVYRLLKAHDLITSPAFVVVKAADAFHTKTSRPNEMWQTDFTYFKIIGWGEACLQGSGGA
jgi:transposase-like protein